MTISQSWIAVLFAPIIVLVGGCACCPPSHLPPDPVQPPKVVDNSPSMPSLRVGDAARVEFVAEVGDDPIDWVATDIPAGWTEETTGDGRTWSASGILPVGGSQDGVTIRARARDANGSASDIVERTVRGKPLVFDADVRLHNDPLEGALKQYQVRVPQLPPWPRADSGEVRLWIDTEGLAPALPDDDFIRVWTVEPSAFEIRNLVRSDGRTRAGVREPGETFLLSSEQHRQGLQDKSFAVSIRCFHGDEINIHRIEVTVR